MTRPSTSSGQATARKPAPRPEAPRIGLEGRLGAVIEVALREIDGLDPCNARHVEPTAADIADLADDIAARGLLNPLILRGAPDAYRVLAGGRRWRALKATAPDPTLVRARVFDGADEDAAALSLAENIARENLHPLDEADRVAEMALNARVGTVARAVSKTPRFVRECVALSALPAVARENWLSGAINLTQARALTVGEGHAIEALFGRPDARAVLSDPRAIRAALLPKGVSSRSASAIYVGVDDYVFAGGAIHEDLFEAESWFLDADLLRKLERRKLVAEADRIAAAEGWGTVLFDVGDVDRVATPRYTPEEIAEIERIEVDPTPPQQTRLAELGRLGALRSVGEAERGAYGVYVGLDSEGRLDVVRGVRIAQQTIPEIVAGPVSSPDPARDAAASATSFAEAAPSSRARRATPAAPPEPLALHAGARRLAETAASRACAARVQQLLPGDVLRIALAALAADQTPFAIDHASGPGAKPGPLLRRIAKRGFAPALAALVEEDDGDVEQAFAEAVAAAVDLRQCGEEDSSRGLMDFVENVNQSPGSLREDVAALLDHAQFFDLAGRAVALAAIADCGGPAAASERAWMKDDALLKEAALLARAKHWVPDFLRRTP